MVLPTKFKDAFDVLCPPRVKDILKSRQDAAPDTSFKKLSLSAQRDCQIIYKKFYNRLCLFANSLIDDQHSAEDIVTEAFINLMEEASDTRFNEYEIKAYLYCAIKSKCNKYKKELQRRNKDNADFKYILSQRDESIIKMEAELSLLIRKMISDLPPQRRQIVQQLFFKGYTSQQVAEQMDLSRQTVINQKGRALKSLRAILSKMIY